MVGIDTEKVFATSTLGVPASTAESTLNLRSFEYGFMAGGYHMDRYLRVPLSEGARPNDDSIVVPRHARVHTPNE
jgi:hypothetical protein